MPVRDILQLGNPLLWQESEPAEDLASAETRELIQDLSETLAAFRAEHGYGRGISAPQLGVLQRVLFIRMQPSGFTGALINPRIVKESPERIQLWDDCFSFPELLVHVERAAVVRVEYLDERGTLRALNAEGGFAELLQHEIDHLDGILAIQRALSPQAFMTRAEWERRKRRL
jgi:peptide deformylase